MKRHFPSRYALVLGLGLATPVLVFALALLGPSVPVGAAQQGPCGPTPCGSVPANQGPCGPTPCGSVPANQGPCGPNPCGSVPANQGPCGPNPCGSVPANQGPCGPNPCPSGPAKQGPCGDNACPPAAVTVNNDAVGAQQPALANALAPSGAPSSGSATPDAKGGAHPSTTSAAERDRAAGIAAHNAAGGGGDSGIWILAVAVLAAGGVAAWLRGRRRVAVRG
jgi:uncharacterized low-complexity protein